MGIEANTQVVLCPGVNDGAALDQTISDLAAIPSVRTISVVPVGATETAEERIERGAHAEEVPGCTPEFSRALIAQVAPQQRRFRRERGATAVYLADEYYLTAGIEVPAASHYDGYAQYENGIGMTRSLIEDWRRARRGASGSGRRLGGQGLARESVGRANHSTNDAHMESASAVIRRATFVCATLIAPTLRALAGEITADAGVVVDVVGVRNAYFGPRVNVSGLLTAGDIIRALAGRDLGDLVVLPRYALDYTGSRFLDDLTPDTLQRALGVPIAFASTLGEVLQIFREPLDSQVTGAVAGVTANGKSWVDFDALAMPVGTEGR
jgi:NifB/MoaA-like Fe-S oxidoreductase